VAHRTTRSLREVLMIPDPRFASGTRWWMSRPRSPRTPNRVRSDKPQTSQLPSDRSSFLTRFNWDRERQERSCLFPSSSGESV